MHPEDHPPWIAKVFRAACVKFADHLLLDGGAGAHVIHV